MIFIKPKRAYPPASALMLSSSSVATPLPGVSGGGQQQQRRQRKLVGTTNIKKTLQCGLSSRRSARASRRCRCPRLARSADRRRRPGGADLSRMKQSRTGRRQWQRRNGDVSVTTTTTNDYHDETCTIAQQ
jgi:hypothetical protein